MREFSDFAALGRRLQQVRVQTLATLQQGLGEVAQELEQAVRDELEPALRDSVGHRVQGLAATVGSGSQAALLGELGSAGQAPQAVFAQVAGASQAGIENTLAAALVRGLSS